MASFRCFSEALLALATLLAPWLSLAEVQAVGKNTLKARKILEARVESGKGGSEAELTEWARSVAALAFLEHLEGNGPEAVEVWEKCGKDCRRHLPAHEVRTLDLLGR
ncbi:MAG: hypothetical protein HUU37_02530 [Bdellovibrionales bacterium]|nr:hypothetical protein [Bdellovibrionales bacterium]